MLGDRIKEPLCKGRLEFWTDELQKLVRDLLRGLHRGQASIGQLQILQGRQKKEAGMPFGCKA